MYAEVKTVFDITLQDGDIFPMKVLMAAKHNLLYVLDVEEISYGVIRVTCSGNVTFAALQNSLKALREKMEQENDNPKWSAYGVNKDHLGFYYTKDAAMKASLKNRFGANWGKVLEGKLHSNPEWKKDHYGHEVLVSQDGHNVLARVYKEG